MQAAPNLSSTNIKLSTLKNGIRVVTDSFDHVETVALGVWVNVGTRHEEASENGIAHMLEHMAFKGTTNRTSKQISEAIENRGGFMNAYTSREVTAYYLRILKNDVNLGLEILADILLNSTFPAAEFKKEQGVVIQEIGRSNDTPDDIVFDYFQTTCFGDSAMGRPTLGVETIIKNLTPEQVAAYMHKHYGANNLVISAAGNVDHDQLVTLANQFFGQVEAGESSATTAATYVGGNSLVERSLEQIHLVLGLPTVSIHNPDYYDYILLASILGGGMSSRLFQEIREKRGLVYTISADQHSYNDIGIFSVYAGTSPESSAELIPIVCEQLKYVTHNITAEELNRVKQQMVAGLMMGLESTSNRCERLARQILLYGKPIALAETLEKINRVSIESLQHAALEMLKHKPSYTALGNLAHLPSYELLQQWLS